MTVFNDNFKGRDLKDVQSTSAIVGEVEKSEIVDEDEAALMQDISDTFNVHVSKPAKKPVAKPTRHSKRIKEKENALTRSILLSVHSTSKPRTTRNSLRTSLDVTASNIVSNAKKRQGKFNINKFTLRKQKPHQRKPVKCSVCSKPFDTYTELTKHIRNKTIRNLDTSVGTVQRLSNLHLGNINTRADTKVFVSSAPSKTGKLFQFKYQLDDHKQKYTRKARYVCSTRDCLKAFTTKSARTYCRNA